MIVNSRKHSNARAVGQFTEVLRSGNYTSKTYTFSGSRSEHEAAVFHRGEGVGFMDYNPIEEAIGTVYVNEAHRGHGLADVMYSVAGRPAHSRQLTAKGRRWAKRVGGPMPPEHEIEHIEPMAGITHLGDPSVSAIAESIAGAPSSTVQRRKRTIIQPK